MSKGYFCYWGKAKPAEEGEAYHLLPWHCLDVAATLRQLLLPARGEPRFPLRNFARDLGLSVDPALSLLVYFAALHDLGKFAGAFQCQRPGMSERLAAYSPLLPYSVRHDSLGFWLWRDAFARELPSARLPKARYLWEAWAECVTGHHGRPPTRAASNGLAPARLEGHFTPADIAAARSFAADCAELLLPDSLPMPAEEAADVFRRYSFELAGLMVVADWLGSDQRAFPYQTEPSALPTYWAEAQRRAAAAIRQSGLGGASPANEKAPGELLPRLRPPEVTLTPLQRLACTCELTSGPQLILLEDVTGAGKTEAALLLAHRLMAAEQADGFYFALPTMATANQMYRRVGAVYGGFFADGEQPSIVLAHGARDDLPEFRASVLPVPPAGDFDYADTRRGDFSDASASTQCSAWLADHNKAALLADIGVGTIDQALLGIVPARHQSLRLYGLCRKVLIVDEVHAFAMSYTGELIRQLIEAHARHGGSTILLSATLPEAWRQRLVEAFAAGCGTFTPAALSAGAVPYPAFTHVPVLPRPVHVDTRPEVRRKVSIAWHHDEPGLLETLLATAAAGGCAAWIRNSIADAVATWQQLRAIAPHPDQVLLFHARYLMADRLALEERVLDRFGAQSTAADRAGWILITSPVLQESLDVDLDVLASDLAPIDILIQRAGREQRHRRDAAGNRSAADQDGRPPPVLRVFAPAPADDPPANWFSAVLPKSAKIYPDHGRLWLTEQTLRAAGAIVMPDAARHLIESVYGEDADSRIPPGLRAATDNAEGKAMAERDCAKLAKLDLAKGYTDKSSPHWYEEVHIQTRVGEPTVDVYLVVAGATGLEPLAGAQHRWSQSAVRMPLRLLKDVEPGWRQRFAAGLDQLIDRYPQLRRSAVLLPMECHEDGWRGLAVNQGNEAVEVLYDREQGVMVERMKK